MAWKVTADPARFETAVKWFRARVLVSKREFDSLHDKVKSLAFTVAGVEQMSAVQDVFDAIDKAIADGESIDAFRQRVSEKLGDKFAGPKSAHLTTVFRTNVQSAYNTGRWYQLDNPDVTAVLPYRMLDIVFDSRTSDICEQLGRPPTILRHDDTYWQTHWPPFHHRCRTCVRAITASEAEARGVHKAKEPKIPDGFGFAPPQRKPFEPDATEYDKRLYREFKRKQAAQKKQAKSKG